MSKQNPMQGDNRHFHHTLLRLGLSQTQIVGFIYFLSLVAGVCGLSPQAYADYVPYWAPYIASLGLFSILIICTLYPDNAFEFISKKLITVSQSKKSNKFVIGLNAVLEYTILTLLYVILIGVPLTISRTPVNIGYAAVIIAVLFLTTRIINFQKSDLLPIVILYLAGLFLLITNNLYPISLTVTNVKYQLQTVYNASFIVLFISTILFMITNIRKKYFLISPPSFLLMTIPLLLLVVPDPFKTQFKLTIISLRSLVVFLSMYILVQVRVENFNRLRTACIVSLAVVALFGIYGMRIDN